MIKIYVTTQWLRLDWDNEDKVQTEYQADVTDQEWAIHGRHGDG